jgi:hypothetical protein
VEDEGSKSEVGSTSGEGEHYTSEQQQQQADSGTAPGSALSTNKAQSGCKVGHIVLDIM